MAAFTLSLTSVPAQALQFGPGLVLEDSVILRETAEYYVGEPTALLLSDDGTFFVPDRFSNSILRFDSAGDFRGVFGRAGEGPGEFTYIGTAGFVADGVLGFLDLRPFSLEMFDLASGRYRGRLAIGEGTYPMSFSVHNDTLWAGGMGTATWTSVGMASVSDVIGESADISLDRAPVARPYMENRLVFGTLAYTAIDVSDEDLMVGFGVSPFILRTNREGAVLDSLVFPVSARRGLPEEDELATISMGDVSVPELVGSLSTLWAVSRDDGGYAYALHQDFEFGDARGGGGFDARAEFFVSSIRQDGSRACPDTPLPTSGLGVAKAALKSNRIYVLDQRLGNEVETPQAVIRRFRIDPLDCTGKITRLDGRS
ncbi:MAG: 6-bladed beta-propeller [bacterium]|nr:6-bladed beta-propeller [bacterium]